MPKLIFIGERFAGGVYELAQEKTTIGRGGQNTLSLHDRSASHSHAEILMNGSEVIVCDLGSANGTFVNGVRLNGQQCQMKSDQTVRFGSVSARLDLGLPTFDNTVYEETAVFDARRITRDQRMEEKAPKPVSAAVTFESGLGFGLPSGDSTVLLPPTAPADRRAMASVPPKPEVPAWGFRKVILVTVSLVLGLAFLLWLIWKGK